MSKRNSEKQINELAEEIKKERAGDAPPEMLSMTSFQEEIGGGPIVDEIRTEIAEGGGPVVDALRGTGLENPGSEDESEGQVDC